MFICFSICIGLWVGVDLGVGVGVAIGILIGEGDGIGIFICIGLGDGVGFGAGLCASTCKALDTEAKAKTKTIRRKVFMISPPANCRTPKRRGTCPLPCAGSGDSGRQMARVRSE